MSTINKPQIRTTSGLVVCLMRATPELMKSSPPGNREGLRLLRTLLEDSALADGQSATGAVAQFGEYNHGCVAGIYERPVMAAQAWLAVIRRAGLQFDAHLAWRDSANEWHAVQPAELEDGFNREFLLHVAIPENES